MQFKSGPTSHEIRMQEGPTMMQSFSHSCRCSAHRREKRVNSRFLCRPHYCRGKVEILQPRHRTCETPPRARARVCARLASHAVSCNAQPHWWWNLALGPFLSSALHARVRTMLFLRLDCECFLITHLFMLL